MNSAVWRTNKGDEPSTDCVSKEDRHIECDAHKGDGIAVALCRHGERRERVCATASKGGVMQPARNARTKTRAIGIRMVSTA